MTLRGPSPARLISLDGPLHRFISDAMLEFKTVPKRIYRKRLNFRAENSLASLT